MRPRVQVKVSTASRTLSSYETRVPHGNARYFAEGRQGFGRVRARCIRRNSCNHKLLGRRGVILPNQVLEVAIVGKQVGLVRVDKPVAYLDIDDTGSSERVTVRKRDASQRDVTT